LQTDNLLCYWQSEQTLQLTSFTLDKFFGPDIFNDDDEADPQADAVAVVEKWVRKHAQSLS